MLDHAQNGLRTLVLAERTIGDEEYEQFSAKLQEARSNMGPSKRRKLEKVYALVERDLEVIGSTAVQDNL